MLLADFDKLKIYSDGHFDTIAYHFGDDLVVDGNSLFQLTKIINSALDTIMPTSKSAYPCVFRFYINKDDPNMNTDAAEFLSIVNLILPLVFQRLVMSEPREREKRLDVPDKLKPLKCSMGAAKRMVNYVMLRDKINIIIEYGDLIYTLVDEKTIEDDKQFIHDADEAPELPQEEGK